MDGVIGAVWLSSAESIWASSTGADVASSRDKKCAGVRLVICSVTVIQPVLLIGLWDCPGVRLFGRWWLVVSRRSLEKYSCFLRRNHKNGIPQITYWNNKANLIEIELGSQKSEVCIGDLLI